MTNNLIFSIRRLNFKKMNKILVTILTHDKYFSLFPQVWESVKNLEVPVGYQVDFIVVTDSVNEISVDFQDYIEKERINLRKSVVDMSKFIDNGNIDTFTDFTQEQVYRVLTTRNFYRQIAIDGNYDYLLQIDGDILVPKDALTKLLLEDENIICGWAYNKKHGGTLVTPNKIGAGEVFESLRNGSYCLLEKRNVFLSVPYSYWEGRPMAVDDEKRAYDIRLAGFRVKVHPGVFCEHLLDNGEIYVPKEDKIVITDRVTFLDEFKNKFTNKHEVIEEKNQKTLSLKRWQDSQLDIELLEDEDFNMYAVEPQVIGFKEWYEPYILCGDGGYEFDITLTKKPLSNVVRFRVNNSDFDFFYQPFLTAEERLKMDVYGELFRPPEVEGSYAVYHKTKKGGEYRTGKFCHIYRPKIFDASGNWVWGVLDYKDDILSIEIPREFLNTAIYPVRVDPTFGYGTQGGSYIGLSFGGISYIRGALFTGVAGTGTNIIAYISPTASIEVAKNYKYAVYVHGDLSLLTNGITNEGTYAISEAEGWKTLNFTSAPTFTAVDYLLAGWSSPGIASGDPELNIAYDTGDANQGHTRQQDYVANWPNPLTVDSHDTNKYSIYATYTPGGGGTTIGPFPTFLP